MARTLAELKARKERLKVKLNQSYPLLYHVRQEFQRRLDILQQTRLTGARAQSVLAKDEADAAKEHFNVFRAHVRKIQKTLRDLEKRIRDIESTNTLVL